MIRAIDINRIVNICEDNGFFDPEVLSKTNKAVIVKCIFDNMNEEKEVNSKIKLMGETAIEILRRGNIASPCYDEALDAAEEGINKNTPRRARIEQVLKKDKKGNLKEKWTHVCPNCGKEIKDHEKYYVVICDGCGQKIDYNYLHEDEM